MPHIEIPDARLWYEDTGGDGVPVVFVHPAAGGSESWAYQVPAFVAAGYRCITYDLRGWGKSQQLPSAAGLGYMSDDLEALVQGLDLERFMLVAAAYGGMGSIDYTLRFPQRVRAFVLATSQGAILDPEFVEVLDRVVRPEIRKLPIELRELGPSYRAENPDGVARWLQIFHASAGESVQRQPRYLKLTLSLLETMQAPTLVLAGGADLISPPALMRLMAERIPGSEFRMVADAGHSANWERPEAWNQIVLEFLGRH